MTTTPAELIAELWRAHQTLGTISHRQPEANLFGRAAAELEAVQAGPIPMILHCPVCHLQHIDGPGSGPFGSDHVYAADEKPWTNPPHKSHLCRPEDGGCGSIWRPADVPTTGVAAIQTKGSADGLVPQPPPPSQESEG